jgi:hypothetical protein
MSTLGGMTVGPGGERGGSTGLRGASAPAGGVLYPNHYAWYVLAATLDIVVTHQILHQFQGTEVNKIANALIREFGVAGMVGLKYASIVVVVLVCEFVGRRRFRLGRMLAVAAICVSCMPVGVGLLQIWAWSRLPVPAVFIDPDTGEATDQLP